MMGSNRLVRLLRITWSARLLASLAAAVLRRQARNLCM